MILALEWMLMMALILGSICHDVTVQVILGDSGIVVTSSLCIVSVVESTLG